MVEAKPEDQIRFLKRFSRAPSEAYPVVRGLPRLRVAITIAWQRTPTSAWELLPVMHDKKTELAFQLPDNNDVSYMMRLTVALWYLNKPEPEAYCPGLPKKMPYSWWIYLADFTVGHWCSAIFYAYE